VGGWGSGRVGKGENLSWIFLQPAIVWGYRYPCPDPFLS